MNFNYALCSTSIKSEWKGVFFFGKGAEKIAYRLFSIFFVLRLKLLHRNLLLFFWAFYDAPHTPTHSWTVPPTHVDTDLGGEEDIRNVPHDDFPLVYFFLVHSRAYNSNWSNRCVYITMCPLINNQLIIWYSGLTFAALFYFYFLRF